MDSSSTGASYEGCVSPGVSAVDVNGCRAVIPIISLENEGNYEAILARFEPMYTNMSTSGVFLSSNSAVSAANLVIDGMPP